MSVRSVVWKPDQAGRLVPGTVQLLDQTLLPGEVRVLSITDAPVLAEAIRSLRVRGAPAIGIAAAMGVAAAVQSAPEDDPAAFTGEAERVIDLLAATRPTAVNLFWALERMRSALRAGADRPVAERKEALAREAVRIRDEDAACCLAIGEHGAALLEDGQTVLTHCNAGGLATAELGTALAPIYVAHRQGKRVSVFADETRPLLQGARLTAWELMQAGIDVTLLCDSAAAQVLREGRIDAVLVGADRIAANGDAANKIGTYSVAVHAERHGVPFYVLAPTSTFDLSLADGDAIPIEERGAEEVVEGFGRRTAPEGVAVYAPAFDVTPAGLITGIICEQGVLAPPFGPALRAAAEAEGSTARAGAGAP